MEALITVYCGRVTYRTADEFSGGWFLLSRAAATSLFPSEPEPSVKELSSKDKLGREV